MKASGWFLSFVAPLSENSYPWRISLRTPDLSSGRGRYLRCYAARILPLIAFIVGRPLSSERNRRVRSSRAHWA